MSFITLLYFPTIFCVVQFYQKHYSCLMYRLWYIKNMAGDMKRVFVRPQNTQHNSRLCFKNFSFCYYYMFLSFSPFAVVAVAVAAASLHSFHISILSFEFLIFFSTFHKLHSGSYINNNNKKKNNITPHINNKSSSSGNKKDATAKNLILIERLN